MPWLHSIITASSMRIQDVERFNNRNDTVLGIPVLR